jgi:RNA polymerase sigma-70 factor (ECF subfamily)
LLVRRRLARLLEDIDLHCRAVLVLKMVHEYSVEEIAEMTGTPRDTVKGRLKRGRQRLREKIKRDPVLMDWARARM